MKCLECNGGKKLTAMFHSVELCCPYCDGTGEVDDKTPLWRADGKILKERRIKKRLTLLNAANLLRVSVISLSNMEIGKVEPDLSISYDRIKTIKS
ncbi:MAG: hypothetical protein WC119_01500 [Synergistaceae bacterium]